MKPDYTIQLVEKPKPKRPTWFDVFYDAIVEAVWLTAIILLAMRIIGEL